MSDFTKITTHLLVKNNENTIRKTLKSILSLNCDILIGDLGSTDNTISICKEYGGKVQEIYFNNDYSKARNELVESNGSPWQLYLEPWEVLATGHKLLMDIENPCVHFFRIIQNNVITKETRFWHKSLQLKFINPIYETLTTHPSEQEMSDVLIYSKGSLVDAEQTLSIISTWEKQNPLSAEPCYYKAFTLLNQGNYDEFVKEAKRYLFLAKSGMSVVMMQYYLAIVQLRLGDIKSAVRGAVSCIANKPLMAEFWCLLGDVHYKANQYRKAIYYYENAIILGKRRLNNDLWPVEINKYKKYPEKMIKNCESMYAGRMLKKI